MKEVKGHQEAQKGLDDLKARVSSLEKELTGSKTTKEPALARAQKSGEIAEGLRKEVDAERASSAALLKEVEPLNKQLEEAKTLGQAAAAAFSSALAGFGRITSPLPSEASPSTLFSWMDANFSRLPDFVGKVGDFAALSSATNFAKTLAKADCQHVAEMKRRKHYESPKVLGEAPKDISTTIRHFMGHFWCKFGLQDARVLAEARRAEVHVLLLLSFLGFSSLLVSYFS